MPAKHRASRHTSVEAVFSDVVGSSPRPLPPRAPGRDPAVALEASERHRHRGGTETGAAKPDMGRFSATKKEEDKYVFRVPSLRNVARTAPYFHDGSVDTLDRAVKVMATVQLGKSLDDDTVALITSFLEALTGEVPAHYAPPR